MKSFILSLTFVFLLTNILSAQAWTVTSSSIGFSLTMLGSEVKGNFSGLDAQVKFDPKNPKLGKVTGSVPVNTIKTGIDLRDTHLKEKEEFFNAAKFPTISLNSILLESTGSAYTGHFNLTMKGVTKFVKIPFTFTPNGNTAVVEGKVTVNRKNWGVGGNTLGMSDNVVLNLKLNLKK